MDEIIEWLTAITLDSNVVGNEENRIETAGKAIVETSLKDT